MLSFNVFNCFYIKWFYWQTPPWDFCSHKNVMFNATNLIQLFEGSFLIIN
jgi:hypothetical protein